MLLELRLDESVPGRDDKSVNEPDEGKGDEDKDDNTDADGDEADEDVNGGGDVDGEDDDDGNEDDNDVIDGSNDEQDCVTDRAKKKGVDDWGDKRSVGSVGGDGKDDNTEDDAIEMCDEESRVSDTGTARDSNKDLPPSSSRGGDAKRRTGAACN